MKRYYAFLLALVFVLPSFFLTSCSNESEEEGEDTSGAYYDVVVDDISYYEKFRDKTFTLSEFAGENVRPTSDRAREALFNILALKMYGARVLDLFAGSGALGIESLSRGAKEVIFNDFSFILTINLI